MQPLIKKHSSVRASCALGHRERVKAPMSSACPHPPSLCSKHKVNLVFLKTMILSLPFTGVSRPAQVTAPRFTPTSGARPCSGSAGETDWLISRGCWPPRLLAAHSNTGSRCHLPGGVWVRIFAAPHTSGVTRVRPCRPRRTRRV